MSPYIEMVSEELGKRVRSIDGDITVHTDQHDNNLVTSVESTDVDMQGMLPEGFGDTTLFRPDGRGKIYVDGEKVPMVQIEKTKGDMDEGNGLHIKKIRHTWRGRIASLFSNTLRK